MNPILNIGNGLSLIGGRIPGQLVIQFTSVCNASCPQCGMRVMNKDYKRNSLKPDDVIRAVRHAGRSGFQAVSFTGGEPFLFQDELIRYINEASLAGIPYTRTGTNGFFMTGSSQPGFEEKIENLALRLSETKLRNLWISIDSSSPEMHEKMRGLPGVIDGIQKALPIFHRHGIFPAANLGINRATGGFPIGEMHLIPGKEEEFAEKFRESFRRFYRFVIGLGFTMANACYPMSMEADSVKPVYAAAASDDIITFTKEEKAIVFKALFDVIPEFRDKIRIFTPRVSLYSLWKTYSGGTHSGYPCHGGIDFFFIGADSGKSYPCGYRSAEELGDFSSLNLKKRELPFCRECDWECFRDPGELLGPLMEMMKHPLKFLGGKLLDREHYAVWKEDVEYYNKCNWFDGRKIK